MRNRWWAGEGVRESRRFGRFKSGSGGSKAGSMSAVRLSRVVTSTMGLKCRSNSDRQAGYSPVGA